MLIEIGLFSGDELLYRGSIKVAEVEQFYKSEVISLRHQLVDDVALIELQVFENEDQKIESVLKIPIRQSDDWESIELAKYTLAFKCTLNA